MSKKLYLRLLKALSPIGLACVAVLFLVGTSPLHAQSTTTKPKPTAGSAKKATSGPGSSIEVGKKFASISLPDQNGKTFVLSEALKKGPVALVIFRSADW